MKSVVNGLSILMHIIGFLFVAFGLYMLEMFDWRLCAAVISIYAGRFFVESAKLANKIYSNAEQAAESE